MRVGKRITKPHDSFPALLVFGMVHEDGAGEDPGVEKGHRS